MADKLPIQSASKIIRVKATPTITAGAYLANDAVGGLLTFANAVLASGRGGVLQKVVIVDDAGQEAALDLYLSDRTFTATGDQDESAITEADAENTLGVVSIAAGNYADHGVPHIATRAGLGLAFKLDGTSLFGQLVTRGTPTYAATDDLTVILEIIPD